MSYEEETFPIAPFVIVVDRSSSMKQRNAIGLINDWLPRLIRTLKEIPEVEESAVLGIMSFSTEAKMERPISGLHAEYSAPKLSAAGRTSYRAPLLRLRGSIAEEVPPQGIRGYRPVVFFITDGRPNVETRDEWIAARAELLDPGFRLRPKLVTFGFGEVDPQVLTELASHPGLAQHDGRPSDEALLTILHTVLGTIITLTARERKVRSGSRGRDLAERVLDFSDYDVDDDDVFEYSPV